MSDTTDLGTIIPTEEPLTIQGKVVTPRTIKVKQLPGIISTIQPFAGLFTGGGVSTLDLPSLIINHTPAAVELVHQLTGEDTEWIEGLELDEMVLVLTRVVEVNLDFFIRRLLPLLSGAMVRLSNNLPTPMIVNGPTSSSS